MKKTFKLWDKGKRKVVEVEAEKKSKEWASICPNHDDHNPSLCINDQKKVYFCQACGWGGHLYGPNYRQGKTQKKIVATYDYRDEKGKLLFQTVRYHPKDFRQRRPDGKGGWIWNLKGVRKVLYRLPELVKVPDPLFIVEGEKDTDNLWKLNLAATTCPMGAKKWKPEYNQHLAGRKIVLIPDNHKQGFEHMHQVGQSLLGIAKEIRWLELPQLEEKGDISDWLKKGGTREQLVELAQRGPEYEVPESGSLDYNSFRDVRQLGRLYAKDVVRRNDTVTTPISNFVVIPKVRVQTDEGEYLKADIITHTKKTYRNIQFNPDNWVSKYNFKKALKGLLDLEYKGTDNDLQDIKGILASQESPIKRGVKTTGLHKIHGDWIYVEEGRAWDKNGEREDVVYLADNPYKVALLQEPDLSLNDLDEILFSLFSFNTEDIIYPLLGFCFSCFVKERIWPLTHQNPFLVCWGEKGSGKTETLERVVKRIFGIRSPIENIGHPTEFSFARVISSSNLVPIIFDEHKTQRVNQIQKDRISEMLRSVFNQTRLTRGTPSLGIVEFTYSAPVVIAGEMGISELAIKDRIIETYFTKKKIEGKKNAFDRLTHLPLGSLGKDFLIWTLKLEDDQIREIREMQLENVDEELHSRLRKNTAHARLGLALLLNYLDGKGKNVRTFEEGFDVIDQTQKKNILKESNKTVVDTIVEAFSVMVSQSILKKGQHYKIDTKMNLDLHIPTIYPLFKKWAREHSWDGETLDRDGFSRQIREAKYFKRYKPMKMGTKTKKVHILDLSLMQHLDVDELRN